MTADLRVGIDASFHLFGGSATHLSRLLREWGGQGVRHRFIIFSAPRNVELLRPLLRPEDELRVLDTLATGRGRRVAWFHGVYPRLLARERLDVMLYAGGYLPYVASTDPSVVIFRNAGPFCDGLGPRRLGWKMWGSFRLLEFFMRRSARLATRVIFPSRYLQSLFESRVGLAPSGSIVLYHGREGVRGTTENRVTDTASPAGGRPYLLYVSHLYPYKNVLELIDAFALEPRLREHDRALVIAGGAPHRGYHRAIVERISRHRLADHIVLTGGVPQDRVSALIAGCELFVFPSLCENCPNALIEAMARGRPIAASNRASIPEICGPAAVYFDPEDPASIASSVLEVLDDPAALAGLETRARARAGQFPSWAEVARQTMDQIELAADRA